MYFDSKNIIQCLYKDIQNNNLKFKGIPLDFIAKLSWQKQLISTVVSQVGENLMETEFLRIQCKQVATHKKRKTAKVDQVSFFSNPLLHRHFIFQQVNPNRTGKRVSHSAIYLPGSK